MEESATVVVVGFGAAGACAAIEAAESGADVLVIDRFHGGGATAISGGVVYAGGGTRQQHAAGVTDDPAAMYAYLRHEVRDAVSPATLQRFCDESADMLTWLEDHGVPFDARLCPYKTSYPSNRHYLYQSGSEHAYPDPAPRGHRTLARGTSGRLLHARLAEAALSRGVRFLPQTRAESLLWTAPAASPAATTDPATPTGSGSPTSPVASTGSGTPIGPVASTGPAAPTGSAAISPGSAGPPVEQRITGVVCRTLRDAPRWARLAHRTLHRLSVKPGMYLPRLGRKLHHWATRIEDRHSRPLRIAADAVVLAAGGFVFNREMMREHAPGYRGLRLGTPGDDGSGIRLGTAAGAGTRHLDRVTIWRFLTPPSALLGGILVDRDGRRICDESRYGAAIGEAVRRCPGGRAWLLVDAATLTEARRQIGTQALWFQRLQMWWLLTAHRTTAPTPAMLARRAGIDPDGLAGAVDAYNAAQAGIKTIDPDGLAGAVDADHAAQAGIRTGEAGPAAQHEPGIPGEAGSSPQRGFADEGGFRPEAGVQGEAGLQPEAAKLSSGRHHRSRPPRGRRPPLDSVAETPDGPPVPCGRPRTVDEPVASHETAPPLPAGIGGRDPAGKSAALSRPLAQAPFSALDVSLAALPAPMLTLGGLTVDEATGQASRPDGTAIPGLYAAGRTASGICSGSYVSGLSLADCVFSGRRAGRHAASEGMPPRTVADVRPHRIAAERPRSVADESIQRVAEEPADRMAEVPSAVPRTVDSTVEKQSRRIPDEPSPRLAGRSPEPPAGKPTDGTAENPPVSPPAGGAAGGAPCREPESFEAGPDGGSG